MTDPDDIDLDAGLEPCPDCEGTGRRGRHVIPDVTGLEHSVITQPDGSPYLDRYHVVDAPGCHVRFHHWHSSDDRRAPHDHPWPNVTVVLDGHLLEYAPDGVHDLTPGTTVTRPAVRPHRLELVSDEAWTLFVTGPIERRWGFHTERGWVHWRTWLAATPPHPTPVTSPAHGGDAGAVDHVDASPLVDGHFLRGAHTRTAPPRGPLSRPISGRIGSVPA